MVTKRKTAERLRVIPLGGLGEIGKNITAFETENDIIVVDCGITFPDESMPGIDAVIPDFTYLENNFDKIRGIFITHGHEDHIGALPYLLKKINVPVYSMKFTIALIKKKLEEEGMSPDPFTLEEVHYGDIKTAGDFAVEFIRTNHSISDSAAFAGAFSFHSESGSRVQHPERRTADNAIRQQTAADRNLLFMTFPFS